MPRESAVGVSAREAPPKSSLSFRLKERVGRNGCPPLAGRGVTAPHECGKNPEYRWYHGLFCSPCFAYGKTERFFIAPFARITERRIPYA